MKEIKITVDSLGRIQFYIEGFTTMEALDILNKYKFWLGIQATKTN